MARLGGCLTALLLAACGGGGGNAPAPPQVRGWTALYSVGIGRCDSFDFGELHYCVNSLQPRIGQTIRIRFTLSGPGALYPVERADLPPATLRLFVAVDPSGYSTTRWWCPSSKTDLVGPGSYTVACTLSSEWTSVGGGLPDPGPPVGIRYAGFTTGGQYFAGHGVAANGPVHFTLDAYDIIDTNLLKQRRRLRHAETTARRG